jgi:hypothetical protein
MHPVVGTPTTAHYMHKDMQHCKAIHPTAGLPAAATLPARITNSGYLQHAKPTTIELPAAGHSCTNRHWTLTASAETANIHAR